MPSFLPGLELSRQFYTDIVQPRLAHPHAAALIGEGSEVLGFDQPRSMDHNWGPRVLVFVAAEHVAAVQQAVSQHLPETYAGHPVQFYDMQTDSIRHHILVTTWEDWVSTQLRLDLSAQWTSSQWLAVPQQHLLQLTAGAVFHDDTGELTAIRQRLAWYPTDVWRWMMASQWHLIGNTEPLLGRTLEANDRRGAMLIANRLVRLVMELCFLQERRYWPYAKWFGSAFETLAIAPVMGPMLDQVLAAPTDEARSSAISDALRLVAEQHNTLGITSPVTPVFELFHVGVNNAVRPYRVLRAGSYVQACQQALSDPSLRQLAPVGALDQLTHADDVLINFTSWTAKLSGIYAAERSFASPESSE